MGGMCAAAIFVTNISAQRSVDIHEEQTRQAAGQDPPSYLDDRETAFLEALKTRGYDDLVEDYLSAMADSPHVSDGWKSRLLFERASNLIQMAEANPTANVALSLDEAKKTLKDFVEAHPGSSEAADAKLVLAKLRLAEARREVAAAMVSDDASQQKKLFADANTSFNAAKKQFQSIKKSLNAQLKQISSGDVEPPEPNALDRLRRDAMYAELTVALIEYERAAIYEAGGKQHQEQLTKARAEFGKIANEHRARLLGLEAIYYQGVCYQELGEPETAMEYFEELLRVDTLPGALVARCSLERSIACATKR